MPEQPDQFVKVTPDLKDPHQNEFVQDYLSELANTHTFNENYELIEHTIEQVQEIYNPTPPPMTRLKDLYAATVILNPDAEGAIRSIQVNGFTHGGDPTWILIHSHTIARLRVSPVPPEPDE